jgi:recombination protein RecA
MKSQQEILEERLRQQRSRQDRLAHLNGLMDHHRQSRPSQEEKAKRAELGVEAGTNDLFWDWAKEKGADRFSECVTLDVMTRSEVRPAIAFGTGIPSLDLALGGGIPCGVTEIYGREAAGKTTLVVDLVQSAQAQGMECALGVGEYFDAKRYEGVGVDLSKLALIKGEGEDVLELGAQFMTEGSNRALFLDSATALRPKVDEYDNWRRMMLSWLEWVSPRITTDSSVVMVNQVRVKRSLLHRKMFAGGTDSAARRILDYFHLRMELSRINVKDMSYDLVVNIVANVLSAPAKLVTLPVWKTLGIDVWKDVLRRAEAAGVVQRNGSWYRVQDGEHDELLGQGEDSASDYLRIHPQFGDYVFARTMQELRAKSS